MKTLRPGDHVISTNDLYGGSYRLFQTVYEPFGIKFSYVDMTQLDEVKKAITPDTKLIWAETPTNPLLRIIDIEAVSDIAHQHNALCIVDNTFASPYLQNPVKLGADASMHSSTKYLGGHSDVIGGAIASSNQELLEKLRFQIKTSGAVPGPMDAYLILRGIKTLSVRVERSVENAKKMVDYLLSENRVAEVFYPGIKTHNNHDIAARQMSDFGAMISFSLKDDSIARAEEVMSKTQIFTLAESLGGVESLRSEEHTSTRLNSSHVAISLDDLCVINKTL